MKNVRRVATSAGVAVLLAGLVGCGGAIGTAPTNTASTGASGGAGAKGTLNMYAAEGGSSRAFQKAAEDFEAATGNKVNIQVLAYADVHDKQILELTSHTGAVDLVVVDGPIWLAELKDYLEPLDSYVQAENFDSSIYVPTYVDMITLDDTLYGLPIRIAPWPLMYRTDLLEQIGADVPTTFEQLRDDALKIKEKTGTYGLTLALKQTNYLVASWLPFLYGFGGTILDDDWKKAAFNTDAGRKSLQFMVDLYRTDKVIPSSALDSEMDGVVTAMQQGVAGMTFTYAPYYLDMNNKEKSEYAGQFEVAPTAPYSEGSGLTSGAVEISGWSFAVNKDSANKQLAWEFLKFAASADEQRVLALQANNTPTVESVFTDPDFKAIYPAADSLLAAARAGRQRPGIANWSKVEDVLMRELSAAINGVKTSDQALADAETEVNEVLG